MLLVKTFHIVFVVTWFAGLFYLPRLFVYHATSDDAISIERFKIMERKLFWGIMTPSAVLATLLGFTLHIVWQVGHEQGWFHAKLFLVILLIAYHVYCWVLMKDFRRDQNRRSHVWYRWFNEAPVVVLVVTVWLVVAQPF